MISFVLYLILVLTEINVSSGVWKSFHLTCNLSKKRQYKYLQCKCNKGSINTSLYLFWDSDLLNCNNFQNFPGMILRNFSIYIQHYFQLFSKKRMGMKNNWNTLTQTTKNHAHILFRKL